MHRLFQIMMPENWWMGIVRPVAHDEREALARRFESLITEVTTLRKLLEPG